MTPSSPSRRVMPLQGKTLPACAAPSLLLSLGLFAIISLQFNRLHVAKKALTSDLSGADGCGSKVSVVTEAPETQRRGPAANFTQLWRDAERNARQPAHPYVERRHAAAIYLYTSTQGPSAEPLSSDLLHPSLSEAVQVLKHSQVMCLHANYRTDQHLNISSGQIRFHSFLLGGDGRDFNRSASCLEINTCFGADVTYYSALNLKGQVLIPPYEVFGVRGVHAERAGCGAVYTLQSNLDCVYDTNSKTLYSISPFPALPLWLLFAVSCVIIVSLLLPLVIMKVLERRDKAAAHVHVLHGGT